MSRRAARTAAVELLYAADIRGVGTESLIDERGALEDPIPPYGVYLARTVDERREEIDRILTENAIAWSLERMSWVDRNILRVAVLELLEGDVPPASAMNEAVDLAKWFSGREAGQFVNGVLAGVRAGLGVEQRPPAE